MKEIKVLTINDDKTLYYSGNAHQVNIAGDWNNWLGAPYNNLNLAEDILEEVENNTWKYPIEHIEPGWYNYKFIIDGVWEEGENRRLLITSDFIETDPELIFHYDNIESLSIAGTFNDWAGKDIHDFHPEKYNFVKENKNTYKYDVSNLPAGRYEYKLIFNNTEWEGGKNHVFFINNEKKIYNPFAIYKSVKLDDFDQVNIEFPYPCKNLTSLNIEFNNNIKIKHIDYCDSNIIIKVENLFISNENKITFYDIYSKPITVEIQPGQIFKKLKSNREFGVRYHPNINKTNFVIFAPRAKKVLLKIFNDKDETDVIIEKNLVYNIDGTFSTELDGDYRNKYYRYFIDGPNIIGDDFDFNRPITDPYAKSVYTSRGPGIILNDNYFNDTFKEWTDDSFSVHNKEDLIIYEAHLRDLTADKSAGVPKNIQGKFLGLIDTIGKGTGIDHIKELGINTIEFLPIQEFDNFPDDTYHWGYMTSLFFTTETSFASDNSNASNVTEFKKLVNTLHNNNIAVIMDVVYNHSGGPHYFNGIDRKYYYRLNEDLSYQNFSGCGNDIKSENPMVSKLIIDSLKYFVNEYHIDGFRFDLAELIDTHTLMKIEKELQKIKPNIILIAEPWSYRGDIKADLKNTGWSAWNDDFRNRIKEYVLHKVDSDHIKDVITGSTNLWTGYPLQSVNYVESHDDMTLIDELLHSINTKNDNAFNIAKKMDALCALLIFTSLGIPMISGGQEFLRNKKGSHNSYNQGDEYNKIDYNLKELNHNVYTYYKKLIKLRNSKYGNLFKCYNHYNDVYYTWIEPHSENLFGYIINPYKDYDIEYSCIVLINRNQQYNETINLNFPHDYYLISDFNHFNIDNITENRLYYKGDNEISINPLTGLIFISI